MDKEISTNETKQLNTKRQTEKKPFGKRTVNGKIILKCTWCGRKVLRLLFF